MPKPTREMVVAKVKKVFPQSNPAEILEILDLYGTETYEGERERIHLAALKMCNGNLYDLLQAIEIAKIDYRDLLVAAEYPGFGKIGFVGTDELDSEARRKLVEDDLRQYLAWLQETDDPDMRGYEEELSDHD